MAGARRDLETVRAVPLFCEPVTGVLRRQDALGGIAREVRRRGLSSLVPGETRPSRSRLPLQMGLTLTSNPKSLKISR